MVAVEAHMPKIFKANLLMQVHLGWNFYFYSLAFSDLPFSRTRRAGIDHLVTLAVTELTGFSPLQITSSDLVRT
jgi:hypothetical protein